MKSSLILFAALISGQALAGEGGSFGGTPPAKEGELSGLSLGEDVPVLDLSSAEMLEAMSRGLSGKAFEIKRADLLMRLKPKNVDFENKTIQFENEIGEKLIGRELIQQ